MGLKYTDADIDAVVIQKQRKRIADLETERESLYDKRIEMNEIIARRDITIERLRGENTAMRGVLQVAQPKALAELVKAWAALEGSKS